MKTVIILNGAPGCGKDTIAKQMFHRFGLELCSMKEPMFNIARAMLGTSGYERFKSDYDDRTQKEKSQDYLGGKSPRDFFIWISEDVVKPLFGKQHFGKLASESLQEKKSTAIFSDGGFPDEVRRLVEDGFKVKLVRLHRKGFTFAGDSRDHIYIPELISWRYREYDVPLISGDIDRAVYDIVNVWQD